MIILHYKRYLKQILGDNSDKGLAITSNHLYNTTIKKGNDLEQKKPATNKTI